MKKNKKIILSIIIAIIVVVAGVFVITNINNSINNSVNNEIYDEHEGNNIGLNGSVAEDGLNTPNSNTQASSSTKPSNANPQKIIKYYHFSVETKDFDKTITNLETLIEKNDGYIEMSEIDNGRYDDYKNANIKVRIPATKHLAFINSLNDTLVITSEKIDTEDVTSAFIDTESRLSALRTEKTSLERLLLKANTVSEIIAVQDRLTDVIAEIEKQEKTLRTYQNLVDYVTVNITINEVEKPTVTEKRTMWQEISEKFNDNLKNIKETGKELFISLVSNSPYIAILGILALVIVIPIKKHKKKKKQKQSSIETPKENK